MVSYKKQEPLTLREHLRSRPRHPPPPWWFWCDLCCSSFFCYPVVCLCVLGFVLLCPLRFPHVRFVFISSCLLGWRISHLRYLCLFACSGVQHILCVCFVLLRLVCLVLPISLDFPIFIPPSVFSSVY